MAGRGAAGAEVRFEELGRETGVWCGSCMLPSVVRMKIAVSLDARLDHIVEVAFCTECDWHKP